MLVLDTDMMTLLEWSSSREAEQIHARLARLPPADVATTIITYEEQTRGWFGRLAKAKTLPHQVEAYRRLSNHLMVYRDVNVLPFDEVAATQFQRLSKLRLRVGTMDLKIAAIVIAHSATLLSRNVADFRRVPGLQTEFWTGRAKTRFTTVVPQSASPAA